MFLYVRATDALPTCQSEGATDAISEEGGTPKVTHFRRTGSKKDHLLSHLRKRSRRLLEIS
jgi:hypothetical protein